MRNRNPFAIIIIVTIRRSPIPLYSRRAKPIVLTAGTLESQNVDLSHKRPESWGFEDSGIDIPRPTSIPPPDTATRRDEAARPEDTSARAMTGIASQMLEPEIKTPDVVAAAATTTGETSTRDRA
ncbi:hypothetical protein TgHK011_001199 [Trichoderma gracile]|nr:hypothetical protein TgHK011_001199 [Trichoderma gracile]